MFALTTVELVAGAAPPSSIEKLKGVGKPARVKLKGVAGDFPPSELFGGEVESL